jgi:hypothetical protein
MSDEKLSGGGRPESRGSFESKLCEIARKHELGILLGETFVLDRRCLAAMREFGLECERDMAERAAQLCFVHHSAFRSGFAYFNVVRAIRALAGVPAEPGA